MKRISELTELLNEARRIYEQENREIMSNYEYDRLYDELLQLEKETGIVMSNSPTVKVGYEILSNLPKEAHEWPMLSLDKTKNVDELAAWLGDKAGLLSWKMDGLTIVLTYENGRLAKALTRGNGEIGEIITANAKVFDNIPLMVPYKSRLVLRGEAVISYSEFKKINESLGDVAAKYKNPRNLCSGTVRQLNTEITASRNVRFIAFGLVSAEGAPSDFRSEQLDWLARQGFETVDYVRVTADNLAGIVQDYSEKIASYDLPSDGLVLIYDDIAYGRSLGRTAKFPRDSIAFKWQDETEETELLEIEWSASRTGQINPVAIFTPVKLEGTMVSRAAVHNVSILKSLALGKGDIIKVYKANMIIPQIAENMTCSGDVEIPDKCPACESSTVLRRENDVEVLLCPNQECPAKHIKALEHFAGRNALNIDGISESTIEKLTGLGLIREYADFFRLERHRDEIISLDGFGEKSYTNIVRACDNARQTTADRLLYGLGISNIGIANAKLISKAADGKWERITKFTDNELMKIEGIGCVMAKSFVEYFKKPENKNKIKEILKEIKIEEAGEFAVSSELSGKVFVITGSLNHFKNREALKEYIENRGGNTSSSVSSMTTYLINNDFQSNSLKNKKAKELGVEIITEKQFMDMTEGAH